MQIILQNLEVWCARGTPPQQMPILYNHLHCVFVFIYFVISTYLLQKVTCVKHPRKVLIICYIL